MGFQKECPTCQRFWIGADDPCPFCKIERLQEEITAARTEAFAHGYVPDYEDDDDQAIAQRIDHLMKWVAESEAETRAQRDGAIAEVTRLREMLAERTLQHKTQLDNAVRLQAIVAWLPHRDGKPVIPRVDPQDGTAERLGVVFRYTVEEG